MPSSTTLAGEWPCLWLDATHLKDCCRFGEGTFAGASVNDEDAPIAAVSGDRASTAGLDHLKSAFGRGGCKF
jgi:hypothetical protein